MYTLAEKPRRASAPRRTHALGATPTATEKAGERRFVEGTHGGEERPRIGERKKEQGCEKAVRSGGVPAAREKERSPKEERERKRTRLELYFSLCACSLHNGERGRLLCLPSFLCTPHALPRNVPLSACRTPERWRQWRGRRARRVHFPARAVVYVP